MPKPLKRTTKTFLPSKENNLAKTKRYRKYVAAVESSKIEEKLNSRFAMKDGFHENTNVGMFSFTPKMKWW